MKPSISRVAWEDGCATLKSIRFEVFVDEQAVPIEEELDDMDESSIHFLATVSEKPVGTARLLRSGQIGRMAVLKPYRRHGIGAALLDAAVETALREGHPEPFLHAQTHALNFYAANGFVAFGDVFLDAGIEHRAMRFMGS